MLSGSARPGELALELRQTGVQLGNLRQLLLGVGQQQREAITVGDQLLELGDPPLKVRCVGLSPSGRVGHPEKGRRDRRGSHGRDDAVELRRVEQGEVERHRGQLVAVLD